MASDVVRVRAVVRGRVQMVGFRAFVQRHARDKGLRGTVRNAPDGTVVCEAEGARPVVEDLVDALHRGPSYARVDSVDVEHLQPSGDLPPMSVTG